MASLSKIRNFLNSAASQKKTDKSNILKYTFWLQKISNYFELSHKMPVLKSEKFMPSLKKTRNLLLFRWSKISDNIKAYLQATKFSKSNIQQQILAKSVTIDRLRTSSYKNKFEFKVYFQGLLLKKYSLLFGAKTFRQPNIQNRTFINEYKLRVVQLVFI